MRCVTPISIQNPKGTGPQDRLSVPCGRCGACQQARRSDWSFRLRWEAKFAVQSAFIGLSYDEENVRWGTVPTLHKPDLQKWFKRVRKIVPEKFRYFAVGEYGTETHRPHYHVLMFLNDEIDIYDLIQKTWTLGTFHVGKISDASIHYCTKYHITTDKKKSDDIGRQPEFAVMSLKPAIGFQYYWLNYMWHKQGLRDYVVQNGYKMRLPRYYRGKVFNDHETKVLTYLYELENSMHPDHDLKKWLENNSGLQPEDYDKALLQKAKSFKRKITDDTF